MYETEITSRKSCSRERFLRSIVFRFIGLSVVCCEARGRPRLSREFNVV